MTSAVGFSKPPSSDTITDPLIEAARHHPTVFARLTKRDYRPAQFHIEIGKALRDVAIGACDRLMIFVPPRHGKSELVSVRFPAWYLGRNPDKRIIATSYGADLAADFGRQARNVVESPEYGVIFPGVRLAKDSKASDNWNIAGRFGGYVAAGVGGPITGRGAHVLLIDDPVKNREEAESETYRKTVWDWYTSTAYTRLEDGGAVVLIMTRWHDDDLAGRLLRAQEQGGDRWRVVDLPALSDAGEPLWPEKYDAPALARIRTVVGSRDWQALYQQRPRTEEGGLFKRAWWREYDAHHPPKLRNVAHVVDSAFKDGIANDYSVIATWGQDARDDYYLLDLWRDRVQFPELVAACHLQHRRWRSDYPAAPLVIEDKASGQSLIQVLRRPQMTVHGERLPALSVIPWKVPAGASKVSRAEGVTAVVEAGRCYLPDRHPLTDLFIDEHASFPSGTHDDTVDTTSMALERLSRGVWEQPTGPDYAPMFAPAQPSEAGWAAILGGSTRAIGNGNGRR